MEKPRIVFMGTPEIAVASLDAIVKKGYHVAGVITAPDKPAGRGRKIHYSPVKQYCLDNDLKLLQPANLKDTHFLQELQQLKPDLQVVVAFRMLPESVWSLPPLGTFNLHASLLPQYRGAAPINWAVINGEQRTGVTTFFLDKKIDTGRIIAQKEVAITSDDTAGTLHDRLMNTGADLVTETIEHIAANNIKPIDQRDLIQEEEKLKKAPKIFKEDCRINWEKSAGEIRNLIRGLNPVPGAFTEIKIDKTEFFMKIFDVQTEVCTHHMKTGILLSDNKSFIKISCRDGFIDIKMMQAAGKKRMKTEDFLRGYNFPRVDSTN